MRLYVQLCKERLSHLRRDDSGALGHSSRVILESSSLAGVGQMVVEQAKENKVDVIVVGRRGLNLLDSLKRKVMGSVSHYVVENAPCDVYVVKLDPPPAEPPVSQE
eukprot:TRINITY_DN1445_c0_g2_i1.p1 TRINITY_DN1445_c0_g2~~TRINITY_DN1445_c0_g2_i1.p1  ORF type:complete len:106 (+),score=14.11 TRINITY_DN1445_c0_g2_i1:262-579(+)